MATPPPVNREAGFDSENPVHREVAMRIGRAWREIRRGAAMSTLIEHFFGVGNDALEQGQMDTLDLLVQQDSWRMGDLADALRVDPSTATRAVQRLERNELARRFNSKTDRRVVMVAVTDAGRERHAAAQAKRVETLTAIMNAYQPDEWEELAALLERFVRALDDHVAHLDERQPPRSTRS